jgi:ubiquinone/menaquinone biosynthesis C-methylase UbiE
MPEEYVLGHRAEELARLDHQAKALEPATRLALQLAGITSGMRVLDLGTGTGEVALLAAEAVGPTGSVVGVDQSPDVLEYAAGKCRARGVTNVRFERADIATYVPDEPVDAVVGRLVHSYLPDRVATVRRLLGALNPGGVYLALEYDTDAVRSAPPTPTVERGRELVNAAFAAAGTPQTIGPHLGDILRDAGAADAQLLGFQGYAGPDDEHGPPMLTAVLASLAPALDKYGIADVASLELDTYQDRLTAEVREAGAVLVLPTLVAAWGHAGQDT